MAICRANEKRLARVASSVFSADSGFGKLLAAILMLVPSGGGGGRGGGSGPVHERKTEEMQGHGPGSQIKKIVFPNHENKHVHTLNNLLLH